MATRKSPAAKSAKPKSTTTAEEEETASPAGSRARSGASTATSPNPLKLEDAGGFTPPEDGAPTIRTDDELDYEPPPPLPIEWTPERAGAVVRGAGFLLHNADPLGSAPGGEELWRATEEDAAAIGPPLARILNRYEPARRVAGVSDEVELGMALFGYTKRNLSARGRLVAAARLEEERPEWGPEATPESPAA